MVAARLEHDERREVRAYLPNTARLTDLLVPDARLVLHPSADPRRRTAWTVTRVWDGTWVALEASAVNGLVAEHLAAAGKVPGWPRVDAVRREVTVGAHRFDLELTLVDGTTGLVEVKSLSRVQAGVAPLSSTPSSRGASHLAALADRAGAGERVAVAFVVQRGDAEVLDLAATADPQWTAAVHASREAGVVVLAYRCEVEMDDLRLGPALPISG